VKGIGGYTVPVCLHDSNLRFCPEGDYLQAMGSTFY
jgi:hypothetical protein